MDILSGSQFPKKVIPLIDNAKKSIDIVVFDWRWYPQDPGNSVQLFNQAIVRAVRRGVRVRAVVNNREILGILGSVGVLAKRLLTSRLVHCKIMIIDDNIVITGSHNYTQNAFQMNYELSVILDDSQALLNCITFFNNIYGGLS